MANSLLYHSISKYMLVNFNYVWQWDNDNITLIRNTYSTHLANNNRGYRRCYYTAYRMLSQWCQETTIGTDRSIKFPISFQSSIFNVLLTHYDTESKTNYQDTVTYRTLYQIYVLSESTGNDSQFVFVTGI